MVEVDLLRTVCIYIWVLVETSYLKRDWQCSEELWEKLSSVIDRDWIYIWTLNSSNTSGWIDTTTPSSYISSSGNDIGVIFVDLHRVFDILRVPEGEFDRLRSIFDYCCQLHQAYQTVELCYWVVKSSVVELYYCVFVDLLEVTTRRAIF